MRTDKLARLLASSDKGRTIEALVADPFVAEFFDAAESRIINDIASGSMALSPDALRALAVALRTTRDLRTFLKVAVQDGQRAEKAYSEITGKMTNAA